MSIKNKELQLNDDMRFLIACCQTEPTNEDRVFILDHLQQNDYSDTLIHLAKKHGILPLISRTLQSKDIDNQDLISDFKQAYMIIVQRNMLLSAELLRIMKLLKENGIDAIAFKGPVLAQMAYGNITLRQYLDLDIMVKKGDIYKIDCLLKDRGYQRFLKITPVQEEVYMQNKHDLGLYHPKKGVHLEMHWSLMDDDFPMQVRLDDFWRETQEVAINGHSISTFSNENLLYYLCIHGSKHLWERIEWVKDIDLLIRNEAIEWENLVKKVEGTGFEKMVYFGFFLTEKLFGTPLPQMIQEKIIKQKQLNSLSDFILESWDKDQSMFKKTAAMTKLFPNTQKQLLYLNKIILKPSLNEYWHIDLPKGFYWGYYLVRPYLLMKKYFNKES